MFKRLRVHYIVWWAVFLIIAQWMAGYQLSDAGQLLAIAMVASGLPATGLAALILVFLTKAFPNTFTAGFWANRTGLMIGGLLFFAAGYVQWFVLLPWVRRRMRRENSTEDQPT